MLARNSTSHDIRKLEDQKIYWLELLKFPKMNKINLSIFMLYNPLFQTNGITPQGGFILINIDNI
jgi:hypothetical protein